MNISNEIYSIIRGYERELSASVPLGRGQLKALTTLTNKGAGLIWFEVWLPKDDRMVRAYVMNANRVIAHRTVQFYIEKDAFLYYGDVDIASFRDVCGSEIRKFTSGEDKMFVWNAAELVVEKLNELISREYQDLVAKAYLKLEQAREKQLLEQKKETGTLGDQYYAPDLDVS